MVVMEGLKRTKSSGSCDVDRAAVSDLASDLDEIGLATCMSEPEAVHDTLDFESTSGSGPLHGQIAHLPENVVRTIAQHALQSGGRQNSILVLLAMCGVCKHWRQASSHVRSGTSLLFDGTGAQGGSTANATTYEQKFRTLAQPKRTQILLAAAKLLRGYTGVTFTGEAVDDKVLLEVSHNTCLSSVVVSSAFRVTDMGIAAAVMNSPDLRTLSIGGTDIYATFGHFLPKVLDLKNLQHLELKGAMKDLQGTDEMPPPRRSHAEAWPVCSALTHLVIGNAALHCEDILRKCPNLTLVEFDGSTLLTRETTLAHSLETVAECCPYVVEVHVSVDNSDTMDDCLNALRSLPRLSVLSVTVASFIIDERQMETLGELPLSDLRLVSQVYKKQPSLPRPCGSHLDNAGVKAFVDAVCRRNSRRLTGAGPLKLSICGASQLTHDAVSALLRLPVLVKLNIAGCNRIAAMDKMRLIAKIKAGRELLHATGAAPLPGQLKLDGS